MINGLHYLNDGDWVESCTALVEHLDGRFEILRWHEPRPAIVEAEAAPRLRPAEIPITALLF